jgi:hypothetical protein
VHVLPYYIFFEAAIAFFFIGLNSTCNIRGINGGIQKAILGAYKYTIEKTMNITGTVNALAEK